MTITDKLTAALEFDEADTRSWCAETWPDYKVGHMAKGAEYENARLAPLHLALVECVKALMEYADEPIHYIKDTSVDFDDEEIEAITVAAEALERLEEALK